jgi:putative transposase
VKFALVDAEKAMYSIAEMCEWLEVSRSGFYAWLGRPESAHAVEDRRLGVLVRAAHERGRRTYGSPRVHAELIDKGERVSRKRSPGSCRNKTSSPGNAVGTGARR